MSIHNRLNEAYKHKILEEFKENKYLPKTPEGLLDYLFDDDSIYKIYYYEDPYSKSKLAHRLNTLWVVPLWLTG